MLVGVVLVVLSGLVCNIEAIRPVVSNNEWTPVVNSQRVYLAPDVLAKYRQQELEEEAQAAAQERYDVVDTGNTFVEYVDNNEDVEDVTEEVIVLQDFESQKVNTAAEAVEEVEKEEEPIIVYPEGTITRPDRPTPVYPAAKPPQPPSQYPPRPQNRPPPPPLPRRPRPPPPSIRRPPPPPSFLSRNAQQPSQLSRNAPPPFPQQDQQRPPPRGPPVPPPPRPGPPRRGPPPPPPSQGEGVLSSVGSSISSIFTGVKCKAEEIGADVRLQDENFVRQQLDCVLDEGPCDELGSTIKRMAPDILRGLCPPPCDECKKKQIQKVMSTIARKYPKEWNQMVQRVG